MNTKKSIPGWYDWDQWNKETVARLPDGSVYVELGCFLGKSTAALAGHIAGSGKRIRLSVVDTFSLKPGDEPALFFALGECGGGKTVKGQVKFRKVFERHMIDSGFDKLNDPEFIRVLEVTTLAAVKEFADGGVDVVFVDADHSYAAVLADIKAWWPKLKAGGVMAGHDIYTYDTVYRGVMDAAKDLGLTVNVIAEQNIWEIRKP
jgi:Methyltransferase domain